MDELTEEERLKCEIAHREGVARLLHCTDEHTAIGNLILELTEQITKHPDSTRLTEMLMEAKLEKYKLREISSNRVSRYHSAGLDGGVKPF